MQGDFFFMNSDEMGILIRACWSDCEQYNSVKGM